MLVKSRYHKAIYDIMERKKILPNRRDHEIPATAGFSEVMQYTEWHIGYKSRQREFQGQYTNPHYRYERYRPIMNKRSATDNCQVHIDVGCGAGVFSWVFLDWATSKQIGFNRVELYGLDHSNAMIDLAFLLRNELAREIEDYPELNYVSDTEILLQNLETHNSEGTDYTITFGHVLVQAHDPEDIKIFSSIINRAVELTGSKSKCVLAAVDAHKQSAQFSVGWELLLKELQSYGIKMGNPAAPEASARMIRLYPPSI